MQATASLSNTRYKNCYLFITASLMLVNSSQIHRHTAQLSSVAATEILIQTM